MALRAIHEFETLAKLFNRRFCFSHLDSNQVNFLHQCSEFTWENYLKLNNSFPHSRDHSLSKSEQDSLEDSLKAAALWYAFHQVQQSVCSIRDSRFLPWISSVARLRNVNETTWKKILWELTENKKSCMDLFTEPLSPSPLRQSPPQSPQSPQSPRSSSPRFDWAEFEFQKKSLQTNNKRKRRFIGKEKKLPSRAKQRAYLSGSQEY